MRKSPIKHEVSTYIKLISNKPITVKSYSRGFGARIEKAHRAFMSGKPSHPSKYSIKIIYDSNDSKSSSVEANGFTQALEKGIDLISKQAVSIEVRN